MALNFNFTFFVRSKMKRSQASNRRCHPWHKHGRSLHTRCPCCRARFRVFVCEVRPLCIVSVGVSPLRPKLFFDLGHEIVRIPFIMGTRERAHVGEFFLRCTGRNRPSKSESWVQGPSGCLMHWEVASRLLEEMSRQSPC